MSDYITAAELKATLALQGTTFAEDDIDMATASASRTIEQITGRRFWLDETDVTRHYSATFGSSLSGYAGSSTGYITIDDATTVTTVATAPTGSTVYSTVWTLNQDFLLEPTNAAADGWPYDAIRIHPNGRWRFSPEFPASIAVTGKFGWPAVPAPIKQATTILATRLLKRSREAAFGVISIGMEGPLARVPRLAYDPDIMALVEPYRRGVLIA